MAVIANSAYVSDPDHAVKSPQRLPEPMPHPFMVQTLSQGLKKASISSCLHSFHLSSLLLRIPIPLSLIFGLLLRLLFANQASRRNTRPNSRVLDRLSQAIVGQKPAFRDLVAVGSVVQRLHAVLIVEEGLRGKAVAAAWLDVVHG